VGENDMTTIFPYLTAIIILGGMGLIFGGFLAYASRRFQVEVDPRIEQTAAMLPGANCGACGFPGCAGLAAAIVEKNVPLTTCPVMSPEARAKLAAFLGIADNASNERKAALIMCNGIPAEEYKKYDYRSIPDCQAAILLFSGPWLCPHRCLGLGSCMKACSFGAITMGPESRPIVDEGKCVGCGKCVQACPKQLIELVDVSKKVHVKCHSPEKGSEVRKVCKVGCIGCRMCERSCAYGAIIVENNLARIDYSKCVECGACVAKCPQKTIIFEGEPDFKPRKAEIDSNACTGCTACFEVCKFKAVQGGTKGEKHSIITAKCVGCLQCVSVCPVKCITMKIIQ